MPSTPSLAQAVVMRSSSASGSSTLSSPARPAAMRLVSSRSAASWACALAAGERS